MVNLSVAAKAVIVNSKNQILILREQPHDEGTKAGKWGLPGGRINTDEPFFDGLRREVNEETGLKIEPIEPVFIGEWWPNIKGVKNHIVAMFMLCKPTTNNVRLSEEHDQFAWIDRNDISKYDFMPPDDEVVRITFERIYK